MDAFGISQDMVVLPYKDSLLLFSRYLQQLVMESLGKESDLDGNRVCIQAAYLKMNRVFIFVKILGLNSRGIDFR